MESSKLEEALSSDVNTITSLKLGILPAKSFYGAIVLLILKISCVFWIINTVERLLLYVTKIYQPSMGLGDLFFIWILALFSSLLLSVPFSRFVLFSQLFKNKLKTAVLIKQKVRHFSFIYLSIYSVSYFLLTILPMLGVDDHQDDFFLTIFVAIFAQAGAFVVSWVATMFISMAELDRLGMGILLNALGELVHKTKQHYATERAAKHIE